MGVGILAREALLLFHKGSFHEWLCVTVLSGFLQQLQSIHQKLEKYYVQGKGSRRRAQMENRDQLFLIASLVAPE